VGIAAAIAATGNRGGTLGLKSRALGDHANHCTGGPSRLLHRRRAGGGAGPVRPAAGGGAHRAAGSLAWRQLLHGPSPQWSAGALDLVGHRRRREPIPAAGSASVNHSPPAGGPAGGGAPWRRRRGDAVRPAADRRCLPPPRCANPARGDGRAGNIPVLLHYPAARGQRRRLASVIASENMKQLLAMEARCRRYM
jgi:hypothetical protein